MKKKVLFIVIAILGVIADQITKYLIASNFSEGDSLVLWPGVFSFTYKTNDGAAWSLFSGGVTWLRWLSLGFSLGLIAFVWFGPKLTKLEQLGWGFILAGAFGNGIDRFLFGYVIDFLHFTLINFPIFNVADVCINIGIAFLLIAIFRPSVAAKKLKEEAEKKKPEKK